DVPHDAVDILRLRHALAQDAHRLAEAAAAVIDDEAGRVAATHGHPALPLAEHHQRVADPLLGRDGVDDLDQLHQRDRVEIVQTRDASLVLAGCRDLRHRQRRGVTGQDGVGPADAIEFREDLLLHVQLLDDRLDHHVAVGQRLQAVDYLDVVDGGLHRLAGHTAFLDRPVQHAGDELLRLRRGTGRRVVHLTDHAAFDRHLYDTPAHGPGTDDADLEIGLLGIKRHGLTFLECEFARAGDYERSRFEAIETTRYCTCGLSTIS